MQAALYIIVPSWTNRKHKLRVHTYHTAPVASLAPDPGKVITNPKTEPESQKHAENTRDRLRPELRPIKIILTDLTELGMHKLLKNVRTGESPEKNGQTMPSPLDAMDQRDDPRTTIS
ncbi:hypothetical protein J6590_045893 [Homalodisca vitripennis]|nr:hypothetical protein J6590_045893 [Homalodisca vitripennis]